MLIFPCYAGGTILAYGTKPSGYWYIVSSGFVTVDSGLSPSKTVLPTGSHFGEKELIGNQPYEATYKAKGRATVIQIDKKGLDGVLDSIRATAPLGSKGSFFSKGSRGKGKTRKGSDKSTSSNNSSNSSKRSSENDGDDQDGGGADTGDNAAEGDEDADDLFSTYPNDDDGENNVRSADNPMSKQREQGGGLKKKNSFLGTLARKNSDRDMLRQRNADRGCESSCNAHNILLQSCAMQ